MYTFYGKKQGIDCILRNKYDIDSNDIRFIKPKIDLFLAKKY